MRQPVMYECVDELAVDGFALTVVLDHGGLKSQELGPAFIYINFYRMFLSQADEHRVMSSFADHQFVIKL